MNDASRIPLEPVKSSQITAIGHDPAAQVLAVQFAPKRGQVEGPIYHFDQVDVELFDRFRNAPSLGSFFFAYIKPHPETYPYRKVSAGVEVGSL